MAGGSDDVVKRGPRLILASRSPRRVGLLREAGYDLTVVEPPVEEPAELGTGLSPGQLANHMTEQVKQDRHQRRHWITRHSSIPAEKVGCN